jgi:hypothetical protein
MRARSFEQVKVTFRNENDQGILENMDSLPSCSLYVDGSLDPSVTVNVENVGTGTYRATWTMGSYNINDIWELVVTGVYDGIPYSRIIKEGYIDEPLLFLNDAIFMRLEAALNTTPEIDWFVGTHQLDSKLLRIIVGSPSNSQNPLLLDSFYVFENSQIFRNNNLIKITIPLIISSQRKIYPFSLRDVTTGNSELQSGVIRIY